MVKKTVLFLIWMLFCIPLFCIEKVKFEEQGSPVVKVYPKYVKELEEDLNESFAVFVNYDDRFRPQSVKLQPGILVPNPNLKDISIWRITVEFSKNAKPNVAHYGQNMILKYKTAPDTGYGVFELSGGSLKLIREILPEECKEGYFNLNFAADLMKDGKPGVTVRKPTLAIVPSSRIAEIERLFISRSVTYTDIPVDEEPYDAAVEDQIAPDSHGNSYGTPPGIVLHTGENMLTAVFQAGEKAVIVEVDNQFKLVRKLAVSMKLEKFGGFTRDPEGNFYLLFYKKNDDGDFQPNIRLVKYDPDGKETGVFDLPIDREKGFDVMIPVSSATSRVVYGNGKIAVHMGKTQHKNKGDGLNHQGAILFVVNADQMTLEETLSMKWVSSHSFDQRLIWDGASIVNLDLADNYPRGFNLTKNKKGKVIFTFKTEHGKQEVVRGGKTLPAGKWSNDNRTYSELGGLAVSKDGYLILGSSEASFDNKLTGKYLNEPRNLFAVLVHRDFDKAKNVVYQDAAQTNMVSSEVVISQGAPSEIIHFYTFSGAVQYQQRRGVLWLTGYQDPEKENVLRPKLIQTAENEYIALWEKWSRKSYLTTCAMKLDGKGNPVISAQELGGIRLNRGDDPVFFAGKTIWIVGSRNKKLLRIYLLDPKLPQL